MHAITGNIRIVLLILGVSFIHGCAANRPPCSSYRVSHDYLAATDHKAIAQYFDRESSQPPRQMQDEYTECWYISDADTPEAASQDVLEACNNSLHEVDKFTEWSCRLVVEGSELSPAERVRLHEIASRRFANARRMSDPIYTGPANTGARHQDRQPNTSRKDKN